MKKKLVLFALVTISILTSCNNPLNKKYDEKTFAEDAKKIVESKKLSEDDAKMLVGHILFSMLMSKNSNDGKTYAEILKAAKTEKSVKKQSNPFKGYVDRSDEIVDNLIKNRKYLK